MFFSGKNIVIELGYICIVALFFCLQNAFCDIVGVFVNVFNFPLLIKVFKLTNINYPVDVGSLLGH